jgi:hypothetical protein
VYYDIQRAPEPVVRVRAIGVKRNNRLYIEGQEVARFD